MDTPTVEQLEYLSEALLLADWAQTRYIAKNPNKFKEYNLLLGPHPTVRQVNGYFAAVMILHPVITYNLTDQYKKYWQYGTIVVEATVVAHNAHIGIKFNF